MSKRKTVKVIRTNHNFNDAEFAFVIYKKNFRAKIFTTLKKENIKDELNEFVNKVIRDKYKKKFIKKQNKVIYLDNI